MFITLSTGVGNEATKAPDEVISDRYRPQNQDSSIDPIQVYEEASSEPSQLSKEPLIDPEPLHSLNTDSSV